MGIDRSADPTRTRFNVQGAQRARDAQNYWRSVKTCKKGPSRPSQGQRCAEKKMSQERREWVLVGGPSAEGTKPTPEALAPHVVSRVGTILRNYCDRYDGVRLHDGSVVFGAAHESHLVSVICGRDENSGAVALRLQVHANRGARFAVIVFPVVMLLTMLASGHGVGGHAGVLGGMLMGIVLGVIASYAAFVLANRTTTRRGGAGRGRQVGVAARLIRPLRQSLYTLGLEMQPARLRFAGIDGDQEPVDETWRQALQDAVGTLAG